SGVAPGATLGGILRAQGREPGTPGGRVTPGTRVTLGRAAATTVGNAAETAAWARLHGMRTLRVVTAGYHMPRALVELRRALPEVELLAQPVGPSQLEAGEVPRPRVARLLIGEYLKLGLALTGLSALVPARDSARR
ncbi:YdcF family protein, partial [Falsiroseomonas oryziterrae]|uniref:YdcF family protein n=1 Tax=Falsiroseomonas oryziterrae TaxID=2911368 RepID=UPI001F4915C3